MTLDDFGGSLRPEVKARLPEAVALAVQELAAWGFAPTPREPGSAFEPLNDRSLSLEAYEAGSPVGQTTPAAWPTRACWPCPAAPAQEL